MSDINTSILPVFKSEWQGQLNALRTGNANAKSAVDAIQNQISTSSPSVVSTLKPQLEQAQLLQWQAAQKYNSFIESGRQLLKVASDAETRLNSTNLSLLERSQLESTRDLMINLASEFVTFKSQNGATLQNLNKMDIGPKTYYSDGRVEWNPLTRDGLAGQAAGRIWAGIKDVFAGIQAALLKGPFTTEENYSACKFLLSGGLEALAGKILKNPGGGIPDIAYDQALSNAINAADPAGAMCRRVYPKGLSPQETMAFGPGHRSHRPDLR